MARAITTEPQDGVICSLQLSNTEYQALEGMLFDSPEDFTDWLAEQPMGVVLQVSIFPSAFVRLEGVRLTDDGIDGTPVEQVHWFSELNEAA